MKEKVLRRLVIKPFHITNVQFSEKTSIEKGTLSLNLQCIDTIKKSEEVILPMIFYRDMRLVM